MVALTPFLVISSLLASPSPRRTNNGSPQRMNKNSGNEGTRRRKRNGKSSNNNDGDFQQQKRRMGRKRYNRSGDKIRVNQKSSTDDIKILYKDDTTKQEVNPLPSLTTAGTPLFQRPSYFTCRHTYEDTLINEIERFFNNEHVEDHDNTEDTTRNIKAYSPYPGLVCVEDELNLLPHLYDPVYALQTIPNALVVSGESIKNIATAIYEGLLSDDVDDNNRNDEQTQSLHQRFRAAPKGSLSVHALVPGMCKGQSKPIMLNRSERIGEELTKMLRKLFPAARKKTTSSKENQKESENNSKEDDEIKLHRCEEMEDERWVLQVMLMSNTVAVASLTQCQHVGPGKDAFWPNTNHPLGLADVNIEEKMPSSAYRKLLEGLECMGIYPSESSIVVDLGASPGGWTSVMRRLGSSVIAVDRSRLDQVLMNDDKVTFIQGDAFAFLPEWDDEESTQNIEKDKWMISDIIAYPERCTELVDFWCKQHIAHFMVVTMKFQGDEPSLEELDNAIDVVRSHGYHCRVKHFFNNKNEVTLMITKLKDIDKYYSVDRTESFRRPSIYKSIL